MYYTPPHFLFNELAGLSYIWASSRQNLSSGLPTKRVLNQPLQLQGLVRILIFCLMILYSKQIKALISLHAQAGMRICCSQSPEDRFSRIKAHILFRGKQCRS